MPEHNKVLARRSVEEVWNQGKVAVVDELVAHSAIFHDSNVPGGKFAEPEGYKKYVSIYRSAFPDLHVTIHDQVAEGDKVVTRWSATGTHNGSLMGIAATHKHATVQGWRSTATRTARSSKDGSTTTLLGLLQQLGAAPLMAAATPA